MSFQKEKKAPIKEHQKEERGKIKISHVTMVEMFAEQISQPKICRMQQGSSDAYRSFNISSVSNQVSGVCPFPQGTVAVNKKSFNTKTTAAYAVMGVP